MSQTVCILGRQPALGIAELESIYGANKLQPIGNQAVLLDIEPSQVNFKRLGGTVKLCKQLTVIDSTAWADIDTYLKQVVPEHLKYLPEGKLRLGLSAYGLRVGVKQLNGTGLELKKIIKSAGRSIRFVPNKELALNSAQVLHNQLTGSLGWELVLVHDGDRTLLAQNIAEQDIEAYAARDQARPKRDAKVGMLPPKLAQIIVNLALGKSTTNNKRSTVLDPFCGTGVLLQEALLIGHNAYGTDLDSRMIEYSQGNLEWLFDNYTPRLPAESSSLLPSTNFRLEIADAINHKWQAFDTIASETYLGRPFSSMQNPEVLRDVMSDVDAILKKFLQNVALQTKSGFKMCIAVPAWKTKYGFTHLKMLDNLGDLGYTRAVFTHVDSADLVYHRPEQIVARELVVLIRK